MVEGLCGAVVAYDGGRRPVPAAVGGATDHDLVGCAAESVGPGDVEIARAWIGDEVGKIVTHTQRLAVGGRGDGGGRRGGGRRAPVLSALGGAPDRPVQTL